MDATKIGARESRSRLSEYLRRVKAGQTIIVTERGKPIGQIVPIQPSLEGRLQAMVEAGLAEWNGQKLKARHPAARNRGVRQVSDLVIEDRGCDYIP
jgi:prevent-host-death family protein